MVIGIAGPISLSLLKYDFMGQKLPAAYSFPLIAHLVNGLLKRGHNVIVYALSSEIKEPFVFEGGQLTVCVGRYQPHPGRDFFKSERDDLLKLMKQYPADIINSHWSYEFSWAAIDSGIPTIVTVRDHATTVLKYQFHPYRIVRWLMNYIVLSKATHLTTNSNYLWQLLTKKQQKKAVVINNFYTTGLEKHFKSVAYKKDYIISVNNGFDRRKNVETGLLAFSIIRKKFPFLKYRLIGAFMEEGNDAYQYAKEHNLLEGVEFIGLQSFAESIEHIKNAKLLLHTSREESLCNVVLEAMVVGTPVVGGRHSGNIPYLLLQGKAGILCDINSPQEVAEAVFIIMENKENIEELINTAHTHAIENFAEDKTLESYINQYEKVLSYQEKKVLSYQ